MYCFNVQAHLHQAKLVFQPQTGSRRRVKLARQVLPELVSSMAGRKCKQVLYVPVTLVQGLKVTV